MKNLKRILSFLLCVTMLFSTVGCNIGTNNADTHTHKGVHRNARESTCTSLGKVEHWQCVICDKLFEDEACTKEIATSVAPKKAHTLTNHPEVLATETTVGNIEYWTCDVCGGYFADEKGKNQITEQDTIDYPLKDLLDFVVEVPADRNPIILQLADPQLMDSATMRYNDGKARLGESAAAYWTFDTESTGKSGTGIGKNVLCYNFITEIIEETKSANDGALDLILITGDVIYGEFDDDGHMLVDFVNFMETFDIPWAPIMGNHDVESNMGADWMCQQYENATNCLFKQGDVEGNGNFTIGIKQGNVLKRVFFNMDTNGCTGASTASKTNGHTVTRENNDYGKDIGCYGLQQDQIKWFNNTSKRIKGFVPDVKISLHIHIAMKYFSVAFNEKYKGLTGLDPVAEVEPESGNYTVNGVNTKGRILYLDRVVGHGSGDFGWLTVLDGWTPDYWDTAATNDAIPGATGDHAIFNQIKAAGTDSIFVGHMHTINASMVYEGIRFQFGQKCSLYDNTSSLLSNNKIASAVGYTYNDGATLLVGGTVIPMDKDSGEILTPYIQYCQGYGAEIDWDSFENTISKTA